MIADVLIFDFDGVILESADIKTLAFRQLFSAFPDHLDEIVAYHEANAGISRFEKFRHIYRNVLARPLSAKDERTLGERFSTLVVDEVMRSHFVPGALEFLQAYSRSHALFIASGTPELELRQLVEARGLTGLFRGVYGWPRAKVAIINAILADTKAARTSVLFVGDARSDYEAARATGIEFVGRVKPERGHPFQGIDVIVIDDLFALDRHLGERISTSRR